MTTDQAQSGRPAILEPTEPIAKRDTVDGTSLVVECRVLMKDGRWLVPQWERPKTYGRLLSEPVQAPKRLGYIPPLEDKLAASRGRKGGLARAARLRRKAR